MSSPLEQLLTLERVMSELRQSQALLAGVPESMRALDDEFSVSQREIEELAASAAEAARERRLLEGAIADGQDKLKRFQQQISRVRNQREYGALLSEIDGAKAELRGLEEKALAAMERAEAAQSALSERESPHGELAARHAAALAEWELEKPRVAEDVARLRGQVETLRERVARPIVAHLERIFERYKGDTTAVLRKADRLGGLALWHCGTCNYQVRTQVAVEIRRDGVIIQCEGCKRFLYAPEGA